MTHLLDSRRQRGRFWRYPEQRGQVEQYPVICALDIVEEDITQGSKAPVTTNPDAVTCRDCRERIGPRSGVRRTS